MLIVDLSRGSKLLLGELQWGSDLIQLYLIVWPADFSGGHFFYVGLDHRFKLLDYCGSFLIHLPASSLSPQYLILYIIRTVGILNFLVFNIPEECTTFPLVTVPHNGSTSLHKVC